MWIIIIIVVIIVIKYTNLSIDMTITRVAQTRICRKVCFYIQDLFAPLVGFHLS